MSSCATAIRLSEDISFERLGNDLLIRLEMDGLADRGGDSIQIKNFSSPESRVEALTLLNPSGPVTRIDLPSLFSQLSSKPTVSGDGSKRRIRSAGDAGLIRKKPQTVEVEILNH